ncbi:McrB family protein [Actinokineospora fastidiosa]|uniref:GTPase subunit of restriction endonuclease n=1 Tax=Actinokineospora fastidiosa TaxID=1816 RepID=A0A918GMB8_9PSEU|nr:AAA family ATPase [Actinokineospora fastidiosa]GGS47055.1 GTPase subunit of restriction endonuclease [Actinokineospora fastidiosa]
MAENVRTAMLLRECFEVLREAEEPLPGKEVTRRIAQRVTLSPHELTVINQAGLKRWVSNLRWRTGEATTIGWMTKRDGRWSITEAGVAAMESHDAEQFLVEMNRRYKDILRHRKTAVDQLGEDARKLARVLAVVDAGSWLTYHDLATLTNLPAQHVPHFLAQASPALPGSQRVLTNDGTVPPDRLLSFTFRGGDMQRRLAAEGIEFDDDGRASEAQRISTDELAERLIEVGGDSEQSATTRAWVIRGSSVDGRNLVPGWLTGGFASLAGTKLRPIAPPVPLDDLKTIVDEDYQGLPHATRAGKLAEFDAFCNRMREGDYVLTLSQGSTYLGRITSAADHVESEDKRSNLRRQVQWFNADQPVPYTKLPNPLPVRLASTADVVDLTADLATIERLLVDLDIDIDETAPADHAAVEFRAIEDDLAEQVMMSRDWLRELADLLRERRQMIFYGPPGTGKTYLARELAGYLAADPSQVKLVQFHPSYTYEDFFQGFRPVQGKDGQLRFDLHHGPFSRLVTAAQQHPSDPYFLIIDEINRANLAKVFGELYFLLEYREQPVSLLYSAQDEDTFRLPDNVFIIGTMNTTDRSIALVDAAMRRRFAFVELHPAQPPTAGLLRAWLARLDDEGKLAHHRDAADLLDVLNERIPDRDLAIGPSFLMKEPIYQRADGLRRVWESDILPLLAEHHYGSPPEVLDQYRLDALYKAIGGAQGESTP